MSVKDLNEVVAMFKDGVDAELGDGMYSFIGLLTKYVRLKKPKRILEWGTGLSTIIYAVNLPHAEIVTIEDNLGWFLYWSGQLRQYPNVKVYPLKREGNYVEAPLALSKFDFVFVDGVDELRPKCLEVAAQILNEGGIVVLHDAEREWYHPAIEKFFKVVEESERKWNSKTVALELKKNE